MGYVDLERRRRGDPVRDEPKSGKFWHAIKKHPYFSIAVALGVTDVWVALMFLFEDGLMAALLVLILILLVELVRDILQFGKHRTRGIEPGLGSEKQLLLAIRDAGGSITTVEAALETSLTVDEADEILTHLADRGHLLVESRNGALFYTLPGRRSGALDERAAPQL